MIWFTADTHFGHSNIIKYCNRPFASVDLMDEALIANWNARVDHGDTVYHLGDFCWGNDYRARQYLGQLKGDVSLIHGNHDYPSVRRLETWTISQPMHWLTLNAEDPAYRNLHIVMCHYAMRVWDRSHQGSIHLYGHSHGTLPGNSRSLDVGVDCWNYAPASLGQILDRMATLPKYEAI